MGKTAVLFATDMSQQSRPMFDASAAELMLFIIGVVFTLAVFAVFVIVLRAEIRRDRQQQSSSDD